MTSFYQSPQAKAYKRGTSGSKWKQAYQAVKHDRKKTLKKASVENLLHALGALYILNLYYTDERTDIGRVYLSDHDFDTLRWVILRWKIQRNKIKIY